MVRVAPFFDSQCRNLSSHINIHIHTNSTLNNPVTLTFDIRINACQGPTIDYMLTKFGVGSSSHFSLRVQPHTYMHTDPHTHTQSQMASITLLMHRLLPAWVISLRNSFIHNN